MAQSQEASSPITGRRTPEPLSGPTEYLLCTGGDTRLMLDPVTGLNAYGCSPRPRPWAVTFASSTASSISSRGFIAAEEARGLILREAAEHGRGGAVCAANERVRKAILAHYRLPPDTRVVLAPSGTDAELAALAVTWLADPSAPIVNILVASDETGTGVPLAATGRHFATLTARGAPVTKGAPVAGFPTDVELAEVRVRDENGVPRGAREVDAECAERARAGAARGARVLLHVMDQSKTGLVAPSLATLEELRGDARVDVVVDACQARLTAASVQRYFERGHMVLVTGSKFFTGPPFAGALILPPRVAARLDGPTVLPEGLASYFARADWPASAVACAPLAEGSSAGLALRWEAALAEMKAFERVPVETVKAILGRFASTVRGAIVANPDLFLHDVPSLSREGASESWDSIRTIFAFSIRGKGGGRLLDTEEAAHLYAWLNSDLSSCLAVATEPERALAARLFHIGQPVPIRGQGEGGTKSGALRLSAGARLVSGEPSHEGLDPDARIERELEDALGALEKVSLILRHHEAIRAVNPRPCFRSVVP
jgi:hypothetical protein